MKYMLVRLPEKHTFGLRLCLSLFIMFFSKSRHDGSVPFNGCRHVFRVLCLSLISVCLLGCSAALTLDLC